MGERARGAGAVLSHLEAGLYRKPDPGCKRCRGRGSHKARRAHEDGYIIVAERCPCTDAKPPGNGETK